MQRWVRTAAWIWALLLAGATVAAGDFEPTPGGAGYRDLASGSGPAAEPGDIVTMHFTAWLEAGDGRLGEQLFASRSAGRPVSFVVGTERVMEGWNQGVIGMRPGGRRLVRVPPALGYGARGVDEVIPPEAGLIFIIELIEVQKR